MLIQFTVENFLSFKQETVFSMRAVPGDRQHPDHVYTSSAGRPLSLLRAAAFYGANASGKSNLMEAIAFAQRLIVRGTRTTQPITRIPFKLSHTTRHQPSRFEFVFVHEGSLYCYGFAITASRVVEEWLSASPNGQEVVYFERTTSEENGVTVTFGPTLKGRSAKNRQFLEFIAQGTRPNQLFLTEAMERNVAALQPVYTWFEDVLLVISAEARSGILEIYASQDTFFLQFLTSFLKIAGTGIQSVGAEELPLDFKRVFPEMDQEMQAELLQNVRERTPDGGAAILEASTGKIVPIAKDQEGNLRMLRLKTRHPMDTGEEVDFALEEESEGTQRLIHLLPALALLQEADTQVILIDELDRRLHPLLSRLFVQTALEGKEGGKANQLIFTTHDTNLLDLELLRRDEIWFVEKDEEGGSHIFSLAEFKIRPDLKIEQGYLHGRFGAIPFLGDLSSLDLSRSSAEEGGALVEAVD